MLNFIHRIVTALRVIFTKRVLVIELRYDATREKDAVTLWASYDDPEQHAFVLGELSADLQRDIDQKSIFNASNN